MTDKPELEPRMEPAPLAMEWVDVVEGTGEECAAGAVVEVHYLGVDYDSGEEFDSSWSRGQTIEFPLTSLIRGWQEGIPGMRVGGRRELVCPPEWAYGPSGGGHRLSGKTLVFAIDLIATQNP